MTDQAKRDEQAVEEYRKITLMYFNQLGPEECTPSQFTAIEVRGFERGIAHERERVKGLVDAFEKSRMELKDVSLSLARLHNRSDLTANNLRAECLVMASKISYEMDNVNPWSINHALSALEQTETGGEGNG